MCALVCKSASSGSVIRQDYSLLPLKLWLLPLLLHLHLHLLLLNDRPSVVSRRHKKTLKSPHYCNCVLVCLFVFAVVVAAAAAACALIETESNYNTDRHSVEPTLMDALNTAFRSFTWLCKAAIKMPHSLFPQVDVWITTFFAFHSPAAAAFCGQTSWLNDWLSLTVGFAVEVAVVIKGEMCLCVCLLWYFFWLLLLLLLLVRSSINVLWLEPFLMPFLLWLFSFFPFFCTRPFYSNFSFADFCSASFVHFWCTEKLFCLFGITLFSFLGLNVIWLSSISLACILATVFTF